MFASPYSLDLRLVCTEITPTRTSLDIWPRFPISVLNHSEELYDEYQDNIIAALEHHDRVIYISLLDLECSALENFSAVAQKPFPVLTHLQLSSTVESSNEIVLHEEFLGGSAPLLESFHLRNIAFPTFPRLSLSATHLLYLSLCDIPVIGYISPEAIATCLATFPALELLELGFQSLESCPDRIGQPPPTRAVLPALTHIDFKGCTVYLEDLVARIDTPKLVRLEVNFFMDLMFNIPQLLISALLSDLSLVTVSWSCILILMSQSTWHTYAASYHLSYRMWNSLTSVTVCLREYMASTPQSGLKILTAFLKCNICIYILS